MDFRRLRGLRVHTVGNTIRRWDRWGFAEAVFQTFKAFDTFETLEPLKPAWEHLSDRSREYYSARSYSACKASWETVARPRGRKLHCIVGFSEDRPILIWPFVLYHRSPGLKVAQPLGPEATEYATLLIDDVADAEQVVAEALVFLRKTSGCNVVRVELVRPESILARVLAKSGMMKVSEPIYVSSTVWDGIPDWETYASRWDAKQRRRRRKNLEKAGSVSFEVVRRGPAAREVIDWLLTHKLSWMKARGEQNVWVGTKEFRDYLMALSEATELADGLTIFTLRLNGRIVAADLCFVDRFRVEGWVTTYDAEFADLGVGRLLMEDSMKWAFARRLEFDQRLSWAEYKQLWTNTSTHVHSHWCTTSPWVAAFFRGRLWAKQQRDFALQQWEKLKASRSKRPQPGSGKVNKKPATSTPAPTTAEKSQ